MSEMKTLTINGKKYTVTDPDAATIKDTTVGSDTWSSKNIVDRLCPAFTESGAVAVCEPVKGYPLEVVSHILPVQEGSGDPSPDNIRPITGHTAVKLTRCGKNLLPYPYSSSGMTSNMGITITNNGDGSITFNGTATGEFYFFLQQNFTAATLPAGRYYITAAGSSVLSVQCEARKDGVYVKSIRNREGTFTVDYSDYDTVRIFLYCASGKTVDETIYPQLELGFAATAYEPYRGMDTFTLDLGQTVYGGSLNWKTGELTVDREVRTFKGTEKWTYSTPKDGCCRIQYSGGGVFSKDTRVCSHYIMYTGYSAEYTFPYLRCNDGTSNWVYEGKQDGGYFASAEDFKAYLAEQYAAGTPVQVICKMAASVTVQLTPQEITALSGTNNLYSSTGDTDVTGRADPQTVIQDLYDKINQLLANAVNNA